LRLLATRRKIEDIQPIKGADMIERVTIDGWHCVSKKGEFAVNDDCIYFEIDSFLPASDGRFEFLMKHTRTFEGNLGHRLRTVKLRKQVSQGLAMPVGTFPELIGVSNEDDMASLIGVVKYEPPVPACIAGEVAGGFPSFIPKTDEERAQNIVDEIFIEHKDAMYEVSIKLDGTSMTAFLNEDEVGVCMRNYQLKINENNSHNTLVKIATAGLLDRLREIGRNIAVQGEVMGEGIQKNRESLKGHHFYIFNIYDIDAKRYLTPVERVNFFNEHLDDLRKVNHVPILINNVKLSDMIHEGKPVNNIDSLISMADGDSLNAKTREGLVWKRIDGRFSFKVISNQFLLKGGD